MKNCEEEAISDICKAFLSKLFTLGANFLSIIDRYKLPYIYSSRQFASIDTFFPTFSPIRGEKEKEKEKGKISRRKVFHSRRVPSIRGL